MLIPNFKIVIRNAQKPSTQTPKSAKFENVWVDHNVHEGGVKGMRIHLRFDVNGCQGLDVKAVAYFYYKSGQALKDTNKAYRTVTGEVSVSQKLNLPYVNSHYNDLVIFMPYDELHMAKGHADLKFNVQIYEPGSQTFLAQSADIHFTYDS